MRDWHRAVNRPPFQKSFHLFRSDPRDGPSIRRFPRCCSSSGRRNQVIMTNTHSRARQPAETAFARAQYEILGRETAAEELETVARASQEETARPRKARLAKDLEDRDSLPTSNHPTQEGPTFGPTILSRTRT